MRRRDRRGAHAQRGDHRRPRHDPHRRRRRDRPGRPHRAVDDPGGRHGHRAGRGDRAARADPRQPHRSAHAGLGQRGRGVDRGRGRADRPVRHLRPGSRDRRRAAGSATSPSSRTAGSGAGTQQHHFSYLGDAEVGEDVNIGAGSVTANFDGRAKHRTVIGDGASIGVDTMLVRAGHHRRGRADRSRLGRHPRRGAGQDGGRHAGPPDRAQARTHAAGRTPASPARGRRPSRPGADRNP